MNRITAAAKYLLTAIAVTLFIAGCKPEVSPEEKAYIDGIKAHRLEVADYMANNPGSPFQRDEDLQFSKLHYYEPDPAFVFEGKLIPYEQQDTVVTYGTKGDERKALRYAYIPFTYEGSEYKVNVYQGWAQGGQTYFSIWFTDKTTGDQTYGVGRYLNIELEDDPEYVYTLDFNKAYNPYCAYSKIFSCTMPLKEDYLDLAIKAGEKKFHE